MEAKPAPWVFREEDPEKVTGIHVTANPQLNFVRVFDEVISAELRIGDRVITDKNVALGLAALLLPYLEVDEVVHTDLIAVEPLHDKQPPQVA